MEKGTKIALISVATVVTLGLAYLAYRHFNKKEEGASPDTKSKKQPVAGGKAPSGGVAPANKISLDIKSVDYNTRKITFAVMLNGNPMITDTIAWEKKNLGSEFGYINNSEVELVGANLLNGFVLVVKVNGVNVAGKIINFVAKNVKDYNGKDLGKDIAAAAATTKGLMGFQFFSGADGEQGGLKVIKESTPPPNTTTRETQKWVDTVENNQHTCRWYDQYGRNTRTYNMPCSRGQANMGQGGKKKK